MTVLISIMLGRVDDLRRQRLHRQARRALCERSRSEPGCGRAPRRSHPRGWPTNSVLNRAYSISPTRRLRQRTSMASRPCCTALVRSRHQQADARCLSARWNALPRHHRGSAGVFEAIHSCKEEIRNAGIVAVPAVGFDVVPTDCLAAMLKRDLPSATHLRLSGRPALRQT